MKNHRYILNGKLKVLVLAVVVAVGLGLSLVWAANAIGQTAGSKGSLVISDITRGGDGARTVQLRLTAPNGHRVFRQNRTNYNHRDNKLKAKYVDSASKCNATELGSGTFDINTMSTKPAPSASSDAKMTRSYGTGDNDWIGGTGNRYFCVQADYAATGSLDIIAKTEYHSIKVDRTAPTIKSSTGVVIVTKNYTAADVGKNIDLKLNFSENVRVMNVFKDGDGNRYKADPSTGTADALPYIMVGTGSNSLKFVLHSANARAKVVAQGATLTFRHTIKYTDGRTVENNNVYQGISLSKGGTLSLKLQHVGTDGNNNNYDIIDGQGGLLGTYNANATIAEADIASFTVKVDTTPKATISRTSNKLMAKIMPRTYTMGTGSAATTKSTFDQFTFFKSSTKHATCKALTMHASSTRVAAKTTGFRTKTSASDMVSITLPATPDNMYYCLKVGDNYEDSDDDATSNATRYGYSNIYRYVPDTTAPDIMGTIAKNILTITVSDADSGVKSAGWLLSATCDDLTSGSLRDFTATKRTRVRVPSDIATRSVKTVCVIARDNDGNVATKLITLVYTAPGDSDDAGTPVTPQPPKDDDDMDDDDGMTAGDDTRTPFAGLPDNWNELSTAEKIALNPYGCLDTTKIRSDNGQCISGGSTYDSTDTASPTTPAPSDDSTTTPAPSDDSTTTPDPAPDPDAAPSQPVISLAYNATDKAVSVSTQGGELSGLMYAISDDSVDCSTLEYSQDVADSSVSISDDDMGKYVCVKGETDDGTVVYSTAQKAEVAADADAGDQDKDDDEDGINVLVIVAVVVAILILIGVIVAVNKKNSNQL